MPLYFFHIKQSLQLFFYLETKIFDIIENYSNGSEINAFRQRVYTIVQKCRKCQRLPNSLFSTSNSIKFIILADVDVKMNKVMHIKKAIKYL